MVYANSSRYVVAGKRRCILVKADQEYLLVIYEDVSDGIRGLETGEPPLVINYAINPSAAVLWHALKDCPAAEDVPRRVSAHYLDTRPEEIAKDVEKFMAVLIDLKFIELVTTIPGQHDSPFMLPSFISEESLLPEKQDYSAFQIEPILFPEYANAQASSMPCNPTPPGSFCSACPC